MIRYINLFCIFVMSLTISSFTPNSESEWQQYKSVDGVKIFSKITYCDTEYNTANNEYVVFKYENGNDHAVTVRFKLNVWYDDVCRSCNLPSPNEYELEVRIDAGQTIEYNCQENNKAFKIFKSSPKGNLYPKLKFEFDNLTVLKR